MSYSALTRTHKPVHVTAFVVLDVEEGVAGTDEPPPPHADKVHKLKPINTRPKNLPKFPIKTPYECPRQ
jgi:hypothetical protein